MSFLIQRIRQKIDRIRIPLSCCSFVACGFSESGRFRSTMQSESIVNNAGLGSPCAGIPNVFFTVYGLFGVTESAEDFHFD